MPEISTITKLRQEDCCEFQVSLGYQVKPYLPELQSNHPGRSEDNPVCGLQTIETVHPREKLKPGARGDCLLQGWGSSLVLNHKDSCQPGSEWSGVWH